MRDQQKTVASVVRLKLADFSTGGTVSDDDVKKAYRRMAMKHHPDRVAPMGETVQKAAAEKFKKVQDAYERIQGERGMK